MGGGKSKQKVKVPQLRFKLHDSKKVNIYKIFDCVTKEGVPPVTREFLQNSWKDILSPSLLELIMNYLFRTSQSIKVDDLEVLYYKFVEGTFNERAQALVDILGVENSISPDIFQAFLMDLMESYYIILRKKCPEAFSSWVSGDTIENNDVKLVINYYMRDLKGFDEKVTAQELREWLIRCVFLTDVYESVMKVTFNMEVEELKPILPKADKYSSMLTIPMVLSFSHLIYPYMKKNWRLLFSSLTDPQSWHRLCAKVAKQGPTIVLIEDEAGSLFGGFASQSWKTSPNFYGDECSFLFRLRPHMALYSPTGYNQNFQYMNHGATTLPNGMGMGGRLDYFTFFLSEDFGPMTVSKSCSTFRDYAPLASTTNEFNFSKLEIWAIADPDVEDDEYVRVGGSIMDHDPSASAILEIAGKSIYSKDLKQSLDEA
ncbi:unnamed protein product [Nezara viridula]|uniref:MTOR-associated protein MEAK7 n=1 Tax=Nezara viridula TaxID=85310 RepID=A0A9P0H1P0_NEZVI|nr:unnamed protein product [Nezara viridula]